MTLKSTLGVPGDDVEVDLDRKHWIRSFCKAKLASTRLDAIRLSLPKASIRGPPAVSNSLSATANDSCAGKFDRGSIAGYLLAVVQSVSLSSSSFAGRKRWTTGPQKQLATRKKGNNPRGRPLRCTGDDRNCAISPINIHNLSASASGPLHKRLCPNEDTFRHLALRITRGGFEVFRLLSSSHSP